jgi:hypothetical protein
MVERYMATRPDGFFPGVMYNAVAVASPDASFADDESRKVYEESIRMAEGADIQFDPDESFRSVKLKSTTQYKPEENEFVKEIRNTLSSPSDARKAVILAEILNRKY